MQTSINDKPFTRSLFAIDPSPLDTRAASYRGYLPSAIMAPVVLGVGEKDEQTLPRITLDIAKRACALGSNIKTIVYPCESHGSTVLKSQVDSIPWVRPAFAGKVASGGCEQLRFNLKPRHQMPGSNT